MCFSNSVSNLNMSVQVYRKYLDPSKGVFPIVDPTIEYVDPSKLPWGAKDQDLNPEFGLVLTQRFGL